MGRTFGRSPVASRHLASPAIAVFQPLHRLGGDGDVVAVEALMRPHNATIIAADPLLTARVLRCALPLAQHVGSIFVNMEVAHLDDVALLAAIESAATSCAADITVEITERGALPTPAQLGTLRDCGVKVACDDVRLRNVAAAIELAPDVIKLEMPSMAWRPDHFATAVGQCVEANVQVVVEGIERRSQAARAAACGANLGQGFRWSRPLSLPAITDYLTAGVR